LQREAGRVYVLVGTDESPSSRDEPVGESAPPNEREQSELVAVLREQLQAERQAHAEARRIIAGLVERIPALEAPTGAPEGEGPEQGEDRGDIPAGRDQDRRQTQWQAIALPFVLIFTTQGLLALSLSVSGGSLAGIGASVRDAFATAISSGLSSITGDQAAIIVSSLITLVGTITSTYLGIRWQRGGRN